MDVRHGRHMPSTTTTNIDCREYLSHGLLRAIHHARMERTAYKQLTALR